MDSKYWYIFFGLSTGRDNRKILDHFDKGHFCPFVSEDRLLYWQILFINKKKEHEGTQKFAWKKGDYHLLKEMNMNQIKKVIEKTSHEPYFLYSDVWSIGTFGISYKELQIQL